MWRGGSLMISYSELQAEGNCHLWETCRSQILYTWTCKQAVGLPAIASRV